MNINLRVNQAKLPQLLPTRLAQTRALKQYKVKIPNIPHINRVSMVLISKINLFSFTFNIISNHTDVNVHFLSH